jgi:glycosyltransferase involved in cell wall biosynthesis
MKPKLRACLLTETYYPVTGGGETQARALAEGLAAAGSHVMVLTRRSHAALEPFEQLGGVNIFRLPPTGPHHLKKWGLLFSTFLVLIRQRKQYDLIFVSGFRVLGVAAVLAGALLGKVCILKADSLGEMSGEFFSPGLARYGLRTVSPVFRLLLSLRNRILKRARAFVAISSAVAAELMGHAIDASAIYVLPNSVDTGSFHPVELKYKEALRRTLGLPLSETLVIYTGRLVSYKGLPLLLESWQSLQRRHNGIHLLLVGGGGLDIHNCEQELRQFVQNHGLDGCVHFTGSVEHVHHYLQAADIFVFPTENEAFGISVIEAMACGLPVVATAAGGLQDLLVDGENGIVVGVGDGRQLERALEALITNPALARSIGEKARSGVANKYAHDVVLGRYLELFQMVTSR